MLPYEIHVFPVEEGSIGGQRESGCNGRARLVAILHDLSDRLHVQQGLPAEKRQVKIAARFLGRGDQPIDGLFRRLPWHQPRLPAVGAMSCKTVIASQVAFLGDLQPGRQLPLRIFGRRMSRDVQIRWPGSNLQCLEIRDDTPHLPRIVFSIQAMDNFGLLHPDMQKVPDLERDVVDFDNPIPIGSEQDLPVVELQFFPGTIRSCIVHRGTCRTTRCMGAGGRRWRNRGTYHVPFFDNLMLEGKRRISRTALGHADHARAVGFARIAGSEAGGRFRRFLHLCRLPPVHQGEIVHHSNMHVNLLTSIKDSSCGNPCFSIPDRRVHARFDTLLRQAGEQER